MESLSFSERKLSREEIFKGLSASVLVHILVFATAIISPWGKPKPTVQLPYSTVNLVSLEDIGGEPAPAPKGQSGKSAEGPKVPDAPKSSSASSGAKAKPFVPVKRLQMDEPAPRASSPPVKKLEIAEAPKVPEPTQNRPAVEKKLDSLIPKPKAEPKPAPITQTAKSTPTEPPPVKDAAPTKIARASTTETAVKESKEPKDSKEASKDAKDTSKDKDVKGGKESKEAKDAGGGGSRVDGGGSSREATATTAQGPPGSPSGGSETGRPGGAGTDAGKLGGKGSGPPGSTGKGTTPGSGQGAPGGSPDGAQVNMARRAYYTKIWSAVRQNWALPEFLKSQHLETVLIVVVRRDGKVLDLRVEKGSGNALYDDSAKRAVRKADPLPPFPDVYTAPQEEIALRFTPELLS